MAADELFRRISSIEAETAELLGQVEWLEGEAGHNADELGLAAENAKLKYRIGHLNKCLHSEEMQATRCMTNVRRIIYAVITSAVQRVCPDYIPPKSGAVRKSEEGMFGDYMCVSAMAISKVLRGKGRPMASQEVAREIVGHLQWYEPFLEKVQVANNGFINVTLQPAYVSQLVSQMLVRGVQPPLLPKKRVVVDFSSPNIAKEMHVGHLRSTIIGETICRLLEFVGHDVLRLNHVGDWGTQFGMLLAHLFDKYPDLAENSPTISDLQQFYKESKKRFDEDKEFQQRAHAYVVRLQSRDEDVLQAWRLISDITRTENEKLYKRLNVRLLERGESFYQPMMQGIVDDLKNRGLAHVEDGRTIAFAKGISVPLTIQKANGAFTYDTSDLAALKHRVQEEKGEWLIYVVDSGQSLHFQTVFDVARRAGYFNESNTRINHVEFGVVLGEDKKKFKSREGNTVRLVELLDEGIERSRQRLIESNRHQVLSEEELKAAQVSVANGCVKYADLSKTRTNAYVFSFDEMLDDKGNTAVYLLYALTRIRSIARVANVSPQQLKEAALTTTIEVSHEKELKLSKCILRFPEVIEQVLEDLYPHFLCRYLYELCTTFSEFYKACYCVDTDPATGKIVHINMSRLLLCEATAQVLEKGFFILGLEPLSKM